MHLGMAHTTIFKFNMIFYRVKFNAFNVYAYQTCEMESLLDDFSAASLHIGKLMVDTFFVCLADKCKPLEA